MYTRSQPHIKVITHAHAHPYFYLFPGWRWAWRGAVGSIPSGPAGETVVADGGTASGGRVCSAASVSGGREGLEYVVGSRG